MIALADLRPGAVYVSAHQVFGSECTKLPLGQTSILPTVGTTSAKLSADLAVAVGAASHTGSGNK